MPRYQWAIDEAKKAARKKRRLIRWREKEAGKRLGIDLAAREAAAETRVAGLLEKERIGGEYDLRGQKMIGAQALKRRSAADIGAMERAKLPYALGSPAQRAADLAEEEFGYKKRTYDPKRHKLEQQRIDQAGIIHGTTPSYEMVGEEPKKVGENVYALRPSGGALRQIPIERAAEYGAREKEEPSAEGLLDYAARLRGARTRRSARDTTTRTPEDIAEKGITTPFSRRKRSSWMDYWSE